MALRVCIRKGRIVRIIKRIWLGLMMIYRLIKRSKRVKLWSNVRNKKKVRIMIILFLMYLIINKDNEIVLMNVWIRRKLIDVKRHINNNKIWMISILVVMSKLMIISKLVIIFKKMMYKEWIIKKEKMIKGELMTDEI